MATALGDVRVLDLTRLLPGPYCTLILADLGADVIKVEDPAGGDYLRQVPPLTGHSSALFHALNRNKRSIALDLRTSAATDVFLRLVEASDVVVESFRPGVMERLGFGHARLRRRNRGIVVCSITGYGQDGPYRERAGHDLNYVAAAGVLSLTASGDDIPTIPGVQIGDLGGGAMNAVIAILAALHERDRSGEGQHCDVAMLDGVLSWLSTQASRVYAEAEAAPGQAADPLLGGSPCYHLYACADGVLSVAALEPKFWRDFTEAVGLPHLGDSGLATGDQAEAVITEVENVLAGRSVAEWMTLFGGRDVCVEPVRGLAAALEHPQVRHRGAILPAGEAGPLPQVGFPFRLDRTPQTIRRSAPALGEHTQEVLAEIGYGGAAYADLRQKGVIG